MTTSAPVRAARDSWVVARRNLIKLDPQAQFALQQFPDAIRLTQLTRVRTSRGGKGL